MLFSWHTLWNYIMEKDYIGGVVGKLYVCAAVELQMMLRSWVGKATTLTCSEGCAHSFTDGRLAARLVHIYI